MIYFNQKLNILQFNIKAHFLFDRDKKYIELANRGSVSGYSVPDVQGGP